MSKVGRVAIQKPGVVSVNVSPENIVSVKGPKGELVLQVDKSIKISLTDSSIDVCRQDDSAKAYHGLYRSLIANMVKGVSEGYVTRLDLIGVGYKAEMKNGYIEFALGCSHSVAFALPKEVKGSVEISSDKVYSVVLEGIDKQLVGFVASRIKALRKVEPYKGKGIRISGEYVRRKAGKSGGKK